MNNNLSKINKIMSIKKGVARKEYLQTSRAIIKSDSELSGAFDPFACWD